MDLQDRKQSGLKSYDDIRYSRMHFLLTSYNQQSQNESRSRLYQQLTFMVMVMLLICNFIGWASTLNSSSKKGPMLATVEANSSALQSWTLISRKPKESARAECRAADGPISARMDTCGELCLPFFWTGSPGAAKRTRQTEEETFVNCNPLYCNKG